jgi:hypothetical protein
MEVASSIFLGITGSPGPLWISYLQHLISKRPAMKNTYLRNSSLIPTLFLLFFLVSALISFSQTQSLDCAAVKNGVFVYFSYKDGSKSTYTRNGETQKEVNPVTKESALWDIQWINDCTYSMQYNEGLEERSKAELDILRKHKVVIQILDVNEDYYVFKSSLDKASNLTIMYDTLWIKQRRDSKNKMVSNARIDSNLLIRRHVYDSAVSNSSNLYVFRPGKFTESGWNCTLYINDTAVCEVSNKSTFIFHLLREGQTTIKAKMDKNESAVTIDVKKGSKYFLRCDILWGIVAKPKLTLVKEEQGKLYFENVK